MSSLISHYEFVEAASRLPLVVTFTSITQALLSDRVRPRAPGRIVGRSVKLVCPVTSRGSLQ